MDFVAIYRRERDRARAKGSEANAITSAASTVFNALYRRFTARVESEPIMTDRRAAEILADCEAEWIALSEAEPGLRPDGFRRLTERATTDLDTVNRMFALVDEINATAHSTNP